MKPPQTIILSSALIASLLVGMIATQSVRLDSGAQAESSELSNSLKEKIEQRTNPEPFSNFKAPVSGIVQSIYSNPDFLAINRHTSGATTDSAEIKISKSTSPSTAGLAPIGSGVLRANLEKGNLPQNEESLAVWRNASDSSKMMVLEGANEYRGIPAINLCSGASGYYVSTDGGASISKEGCLPPLSGMNNEGYNYVARSFGDPSLDVFNANGTFFYKSLYIDDLTGTSAIGLSKAKFSDLSKKSLPDEKVWKTVAVRANGYDSAFNDAGWIAVNNQEGTAGYGHIYVTWTVFDFYGYGSHIVMADCTQSPFNCTMLWDDGDPVSEYQGTVQSSRVSVDSAGRIIVSWIEYDFTPTSAAPYYTVNLWYRVFKPGGADAVTEPTLIKTLDKPVSFDFASQGNEFRIAAEISAEPAVVGTSKPRLFVSYFDCRNGSFLLDVPQFSYASTCSNVDLWMMYIDNYQKASPTFSKEFALQKTTDTHAFYPAMSVNQQKGVLDIAWLETDSTKHNLDAAYSQRSLANPATIITPPLQAPAGTPDKDAFFFPSGGFIGDYIQIRTLPSATPGGDNQAFVGFNGNTRFANPYPYYIGGEELVKLGGNQDDNYIWSQKYN